MATNDATIIATRLTSDELEKSINELVSKVDRAMGAMAKSVDNAIGSMKGSFGQLAKNTRDSATAAKELAMGYDSVADSLTKAMSKGIGTFGGFGTKQVLESEKQALLDFNKTYHESVEKARSEQDRLNKISEIGRLSAQQSMRPRERWDVLQDSEINRLRMTIHGLESDLKRLDNLSLRQAQQQFSEYDALIKQARAEIEKLKQTPISDPNQRTALIQQIRDYENEIKRLQAEQNKINPLSFNSEARGRLTQELQAAKNEVRQMGQALIDADNEEKKLTQGAKQYTAEIQRRAQAIRESTELQEKGRVEIQSSANAARTYIISAKSRLSIEERLLEIQKQETAELERQRTGGIRTTGSGSGEIGIKATREEIEKLIQAQRAADPVAAAMVERAYQVEASMDRGATAIGRNRQETRMTFGDYENLRAAIAAVLNVEQHRVQLVDQEIASYNKLNESLKQMTQAYQKLGSSDRSSDMGKNLASEIQKTQRAINEIQKQMTRPVSLRHAFGLEEKTLDQISYKIQQLGSYMRGLDITNQRSSNEINQVTQAMNRLKQKQTEILGENARLTSSNNALARSFNYMKNRLAFYFTVGASTQFVKQLIDIRSQYEMNERALGILIGSAEYGTKVFNELSQMALVSPYTLIELSSAAKQLTAYDVAAKDVVDTTRRLADMAAAVGIPMERLTYALGQIKAYGYLNSRDNRMFANAGIPLVKQLADYYTEFEGRLVSTADVYDRIKKKAVGYNDVMQVIYKMTDEGGKFFDFQAKMADTLKVRLANLTLAWNNMLNEMGKESQGVLTWTIGALRTLFLHWKQLDDLIKNAAWVVGIRTAVMLIVYAALKAGNALGIITKQMALSEVVGKRLAGALRTLGQSLATIAKSPITWWSLLAIAAFEATTMILGTNEAMKELNKSLRDAGEENFKNISEFLNQYQDIRAKLYKETVIPIEGGKSEKSVVTPTDLSKDEAAKVWEAMREQIELSTAASNEYIGQLIKIENVSERIRVGFKMLDEIQQVNSAFKELGDTAIAITQDWSKWWNLWSLPDGLIDNLKDVNESGKEIFKTYKDVEDAWKAVSKGEGVSSLKNDLQNYESDLETLREDIQKTTESIDNFNNSMGFSGNPTQVLESYANAMQKIVTQGQLNPEQAFLLQTEMEESRRKAVMNALAIRINDEVNASKVAEDEKTKISLQESINRNRQMYDLYKNSTDKELAYWENFTKYLSENHKSEMQTMFQNMDEEQLRSINWQEEKYQEFINRTVESYARRHNTTYNNVFNHLRNLINNANAWEIFIKLTISTEGGKSFNEQLNEYDKRANELYDKIKRNQERIKQIEGMGWNSTMNKHYKEYNSIMQETLEYQKEYNDITSKEKGGKSSRESADAKKAETAARKGAAAAARAQRQAESELQKALKEELSLIDKVRSTYKTLTKEGVDSQTALTESTSGYEKTVRSINKTLGKFGITPLDLTKYAGVSNPREIMNMLQSQLDKLSKSGAVKPAEIKDLQVKLKDLKIDSITFDQKAITTSLNNELSKLKEEYELAVELDANPELGDMFADMFDIDTTEFPKSIDEYMWNVQDAFEKAVDDMKLDEKGKFFDVFTANEADWKQWAERVGMAEEALKNFNSKFVEARDYAMKWARDTIKATQDLEYKLADNNGKIAIEEEKLANLRKQLANEVNEEQRHLLELQIQDQENAIARLKDEAVSTLSTYKNLFNSIVEHSARVTRMLAQQWKGALENAVKNADNTYTITDPNSGETSTVSEEKYNKLLNQVNGKLRDTQTSFDKIKEALTKGEDELIDWVKAMELIADEAKKVSDGVKTIGNISEILGASENTVEIINDIADSIDGLATTAQGIAQMSTDPIGGTLNVVKGLWQSVSSWFDNSNKKIDKKVKESERNVARLEIAYKRLEHAVENSMGTAETQARRATIANKELQLTEKQRQLDLEKSRKSKNQDQDKIIQLEGEIQDLEFEIENLAKGVADSLLGSDIKSAAEDFVDTWVSAWKEGEKTLDAMNEKVDEMIYNLIKKAATSAIVGKIIKPLYDAVDKYTSDASAGGAELTMSELKALAELASTLGVKIDTALGAFYNNLEAQNIISKGAASSNLSALQQGIQGITEDTAGALEAYMNIVSQQVFLHSDLLTQIRDAVVMMSGDVQLATQAQMLLQLQQSYSVQMAIQAILEGWTNANGMAVRVELTN